MMIYEPRGRAKEYFELAANLYRGCVHGCRYCYGPATLRMKPEDFHAQAVVRKNALPEFAKDAQKLEGDKRTILLSFTTDPYQPINEERKLTRGAIAAAQAYGLKVAILTKAGLRATMDFDLLCPGSRGKTWADEFGVTLTVLDEVKRKEWEPNASPAAERVESLAIAKKAGIKTFVSLEPILGIGDAMEVIQATAAVADRFLVGKLNYHPAAKEINWTTTAKIVFAALEATGKPYYIKRDLASFLGKPDGILKA